MQKVRLMNIPANIQKTYNIGTEVEAIADDSVIGGHLAFVNLQGEDVNIDAVELFGTEIIVREL